MACQGEYGFMVAYRNREIVKVPLAEIAGKLKLVDPDSSIIQEARMLGISFGDKIAACSLSVKPYAIFPCPG